jgi:hypothetical protein
VVVFRYCVFFILDSCVNDHPLFNSKEEEHYAHEGENTLVRLSSGCVMDDTSESDDTMGKG